MSTISTLDSTANKTARQLVHEWIDCELRSRKNQNLDEAYVSVLSLLWAEYGQNRNSDPEFHYMALDYLKLRTMNSEETVVFEEASSQLIHSGPHAA